MSLIKWTPLVEFDNLNQTMNKMMQNFWDDSGTMSGTKQLAINVKEHADSYEVHTAVPGVKKEDIEIQIDNGVLTIKGETRQESEEKENGKYLRREVYSGSFFRQLSLPSNIDATKVDAKVEDGMLMITIPKSPEAQPKRIAIK